LPETADPPREDRFQRVRELMDSGKVADSISEPLVAGVDLGTSNIQVIVVDAESRPVAARFEWDSAVRDGMVVDFMEAREQLNGMMEALRSTLGEDYELEYASVGYPPGTEAWVESNVVEDLGFEILAEVNEPSAAAESLDVHNGAIVDIGGGTTGISVVEGGEIVYSADEATGGHHLSLVLSGNRSMDFEEAEAYRRDTPLTEYIGVVQPVVEKMAGIVETELRDFPDVETVYIVGGTVIPEGFEDVFGDVLDREVIKPEDPILVTPLGIGLAGAREATTGSPASE
jgi:ethanolamine utilization protein EutJ